MALVDSSGLGLVQPYVYVPVVQQSSQPVNYVNSQNVAAAYALCAQDLKLNWTSGGNSGDNFHIYVGDLSFDIEADQLKDAFKEFGEIADVKIIRDAQTMKSKGFGFVSFYRKQDADQAISAMNGQWLGSRAIKTGWAARRTVGSKVLTFEDVASQSSPTNTTVYCGGVAQGCTNELMRQYFAEFGHIVDIRCFADKGYAFIRFQTKDQAVAAILHRHGTDINGYTVKCSWGKEAETGSPQQPLSPNISTTPTTTSIQAVAGRAAAPAFGGYTQSLAQYPGGIGAFTQPQTWTSPYTAAGYPANYQGTGLVAASAPATWGLAQPYTGYQATANPFQPGA